MEGLKFKHLSEKKEPQKLVLSEDFFYMIDQGGWAAPEGFLEEEDAQRVRDAINLINQYRKEGLGNRSFLDEEDEDFEEEE